MKLKKIESEINPSNILLKLNWASSIEILNDKEKSTILTNIFRYHTGEDLVPMTKAASLFFSSAKDVFDYNIEKYQQKVEGNRINGRKGGRPKINYPDGFLKNPNNPDGFFQNPNNPKDRDIDRDIDIDKPREKEIVIENDKTTGNLDLKIKYEKFKKISRIELDQVDQSNERIFCAEVKELADEVGWTQFFNLILGTSLNEALEIINKLELGHLETSVIEIRKHHHYFLEKLVK